MCGRSRATLSPQQVTAAAGVPLERWRNSEQYQPSYNVSPGFSTPVVRQSSAGKPELQTMKWGLVPSYTKAGEKPDFFRMFNARSESVAEKGVFKRLLSRHRCVVLLNGFYEWAKEGKHKQPYYIHMGTGEGDVIRMAGLFDCWDNGPEGPMYTYTILTTDSSKRLQWLHDRMPVILPDEAAAEQWLAGEALDHKELSRIAEPYNGDDLRWHKVSPAMSNMRYQGADCAKELKRESVASFFKPVAGKAKATAGGEAAPLHDVRFGDARSPAGKAGTAGKAGKAAPAAASDNQVVSGPPDKGQQQQQRTGQTGHSGQPEDNDGQPPAEGPEAAAAAAAAAPVDVSTGVATDLAAVPRQGQGAPAFVAAPARHAQTAAAVQPKGPGEQPTKGPQKKRPPASPAKTGGSAAKKAKPSPPKGQGRIDAFFTKNSK